MTRPGWARWRPPEKFGWARRMIRLGHRRPGPPYGDPRPPAHAVRERGLARDVLHRRPGALAARRHRQRVGADPVARGPGRRARGAQGADPVAWTVEDAVAFVLWCVVLAIGAVTLERWWERRQRRRRDPLDGAPVTSGAGRASARTAHAPRAVPDQRRDRATDPRAASRRRTCAVHAEGGQLGMGLHCVLHAGPGIDWRGVRCAAKGGDPGGIRNLRAARHHRRHPGRLTGRTGRAATRPVTTGPDAAVGTEVAVTARHRRGACYAPRDDGGTPPRPSYFE